MSIEKKNKTKSRIRETLIGAVVALVFSPIGIFIGFNLNDYLARDNLSIVGIELFPEVEELHLNDESILFLRRSWIYKNYERENYLSYNSILRLVIEEDQSLNQNNIAAFLNQLTKLESYTSEIEGALKSALHYLENYKPNLQPPEELRTHQSIFNYFFLYADKIKDASFRNNWINDIKSSLLNIKEARIRIRGFQAISHTYRFPRTGRMRIKVLIVNKGNTDGLVSGEGKLVMIDEDKATIEITAYRRTPDEYGSQKVYFESVPKRSITILELYVDEERTSPNELSSLERALKNNNPDRVLVKLVDARDRSFQFKMKTLPVEASE